MAGTDECESCHEDLTSLGGGSPLSKMQKVLMSDTLAKLEPQKPIFVSRNSNLLDAVRTMNQAKIGCVLVGDENHLEGILSERDVVLKGVCCDKDLTTLKVSELMTPNPETLTGDDSLAFAVNKMSVGGYRHIPILKQEKIAGIISIRDVLRYLSGLI